MNPIKSGKAPKANARTTRASPKNPCQKTRQLDGLMRLMLRETGKAVQFEISAEQGSKVYIAGTFNNWDPTTHPLSDDQEEGVFKATLYLPAGTHEYKFIVNGVWSCGGKCSQQSPKRHDTNRVFRI